ncbi:MAG: DNA polymerase III subunit delta [Alphaproteobacteria bacterium]|nr:MAG: DNA polymerase III subunit delta [Alphaproteobacteria bacterium]
MELPGQKFDAFLKSRDPKLRLFLLYGADEGLVRERGRALCLSVLGTLDDPFSYSEIDAGELGHDPARLMDEATALSMMGGERVVRLRNATGNHKDQVASLADLPLEGSIVVIEAGDLKKDSALVKMVKGAPHGAVTPCFHDKAQDMNGLIQEMLGSNGIHPTREITDYLRENLGGDRAISRQELDKLILYHGKREAPLTLDEVREIIGDSSDQNVFDIMDAALLGQLDRLERLLGRAFEAGESPIAFLRLIQNQLKQLHKAAALRDAGMRPEDAIRKSGIPYYNQKKAAIQISGKGAAHMATGLDITLKAEIDCKTTGYPAETICRRALMRIAMASRRR